MDKYKKLASNTLIFAIGTFSSKILFVFVNAVCNKNDGYGRLRLRRLGSANS